MRPFPLWCDGIDALEQGVASCLWRLCSWLTVARTTPSSTLDEAALLRYLAEAPWYPYVLVHGRYGVEWAAGDSAREATATIATPQGIRASCTFTFDDKDIVHVRATRAMLQKDGTFVMVGVAQIYA